MKISIDLGVSENTGHRICDLEDLNLTQENWDSMSDNEKQEAIQDWVDELPEHPYWVVDRFSEN